MKLAFLAYAALLQVPAEAPDTAPIAVSADEQIAQEWLADRLLDYESARIKLVVGARPTSFKKTLIARVEGTAVCYNVNAKNGFGGYAGNDRTLIVVKDGKVIYSASEQYPDGYTAFDVVSEVCGKTDRDQRRYFEPISENQRTRSR